MSDPTAPDQPAYPPVLTPAAAAAAAQSAANPPDAPAPEPPPEVPAAAAAAAGAEAAPAPKPAASWKAWAAAGAACGIVVLGGIVLTRDDDDPAPVSTGDGQDQVGTAFGPAGRGAQGEITDIDGTTIRLTSTEPGGDTSEVTVETDDDTTFVDVIDGEVADIQVGDNLLVQGASTDGAVAAERITDNGDEALGGGPMSPGDGPVLREGELPDGAVRVFPEGAEPPEGFTPPDGAVMSQITVGEVTAIDGGRITLETSEGEEVVVTTTDATEVTVSEEIALDDLQEGDEIRVVGEREDDVVTAESVRRGDAGMVFGGPGSSTRSNDSGSADSSS